MKIELGFLPRIWISDAPDSGGYFPFAIDGEMEYIIEFSLDREKETEQFVPKYMHLLNKFPLFVMAEIYDDQREELEQDCHLLKIQFETINPKKKNDCFYKIKIDNNKQLEVIYPFLYGNGSMNNMVLWSLETDVFSYGKRKFKNTFLNRDKYTVIAKMNDNNSIFWISYDGSSVIAISNDNHFSTINEITKKLPLGVNYEVSEYGND
ncbi:hypothetical protein [Fictibacillus phosphorivorans]|jgi:hypothetical protein|uniref:hypothetical protein n=1 Tax=Fictibacillus phosphorivorans TaxID=1221500 RepID=UPI00119EEA9A|nr:hypothetical protein [Fictibacillus phosphorivorans]